MHIDPDSTIADVPVLKIRALLRYDTLQLQHACRLLRCDEYQARLVLAELQADGYIEGHPVLEDAWTGTIRGNALANASAARPVKRATAQRALDEFMARVEAVNAYDEYLYRVGTVLLFGSFLGAAPVVNDVDLAIELVPRHGDPETQFELGRARTNAAARTFQNFTAALAWPRTEVFQFLKARSRILSLHDLEDQAPLIARVPHRLLAAGPHGDAWD